MATWVYGDLNDETLKESLNLEGDKANTEDQIRKKKRRGIGEAQFEQLWRAVIDEVVKDIDG